MSRVLWINAANGVAGDMLLAALIDAGADRLAVMDAWAALSIDGYAATWERVDRQGVGALWTNLVVDDHGEHPHRPAHDVLALLEAADLDERVRRDAMAVYRRLAEVEGRVHDIEPADVELHEVGAVDSILDIVGVCAALSNLGIERLVFAPIAVGHGTITAAHGTLPNPAPAVVHLLADAGAPTIGVDTGMELTTPTGAALLTALGSAGPMPSMTVTATGFGAGTADPAGRANVVNVLVGDTDGEAGSDEAWVLETNVDDVTGEVLAHTVDRLLAVGAVDAWVTPIVMKKGRPAHTVAAMCDAGCLDEVRAVLLAETGSLGARAYRVRRWPAPRTRFTVTIEGHEIGIKIADHRVKIEHDDAAAAAKALGRPLREILHQAEQLAADTRP